MRKKYQGNSRLGPARELPRSFGAVTDRDNPGETDGLLVLGRTSWDERTRRYVRRGTVEGKSERDILRCLKRCLQGLPGSHGTGQTSFSSGTSMDIGPSVGASERNEWLVRVDRRTLVA